MRRVPNRYLAAYIVVCDVVLLLFALPLQKYALQAATSPATGAPLIFALLVVNVLVLLAVIAAGLASCGLTVRAALGGLKALRGRRP